ncbi:hypothetical protein GOODEAATRI_020235, partial [Goodea atripinnis]
ENDKHRTAHRERVSSSFLHPPVCFLQKNWVNEYHRKCREVVGAELERQGRMEALQWLIRETQAII